MSVHLEAEHVVQAWTERGAMSLSLSGETGPQINLGVTSVQPLDLPEHARPTVRQLSVLREVHAYIIARGFAPTLREIGARMRINSTNGIRDHLLALERKGLLSRAANCARGFSVTALGLSAVTIELPPPKAGAPAPPVPRRGPSWVKGRVYFIEADGAGRVKIGFTKGNVQERLRQIQTGSPFPLRVVAVVDGSLQRESNLHARFRHLRVAPNVEWFHFGQEIRDFLVDEGALHTERDA